MLYSTLLCYVTTPPSSRFTLKSKYGTWIHDRKDNERLLPVLSMIILSNSSLAVSAVAGGGQVEGVQLHRPVERAEYHIARRTSRFGHSKHIVHYLCGKFSFEISREVGSVGMSSNCESQLLSARLATPVRCQEVEDLHVLDLVVVLGQVLQVSEATREIEKFLIATDILEIVDVRPFDVLLPLVVAEAEGSDPGAGFQQLLLRHREYEAHVPGEVEALRAEQGREL